MRACLRRCVCKDNISLAIRIGLLYLSVEFLWSMLQHMLRTLFSRFTPRRIPRADASEGRDTAPNFCQY